MDENRARLVRRVALAALAAEETVRRYLDGYDVRPLARARIEVALREVGRADLVRGRA